MPRDSNGNYTLPAGNPVVTGTPIETAWANPSLGDIGAELTNSLDRNGRGGMLAPFRFVDGTLAQPAMTFTSEPSTGFFRAGASDLRAGVAGISRMRWTATGVDIWNGAAWVPVASTANLANFVTLDGAQTITGAKTFTAQAAFSLVPTVGGVAVALSNATVNLTGDQTVQGTKQFIGAGPNQGWIDLGNNLRLNGGDDFGGFQVSFGGVVRFYVGPTYGGGVLIDSGGPSALIMGNTAIVDPDSRYWSWEIAADNIAFITRNGTLGGVNTALSISRGVGGAMGEIMLAANNFQQFWTQQAGTGASTTGARLRHAGGAIFDIGLNVMPFIQVGGNLSLNQTHIGQTLFQESVSAVTFQLPGAGDTSIPDGGAIVIVNWGQGVGVLTIADVGGVQLFWPNGAGATLTGPRTVAPGSVVTLVKRLGAQWWVWGSGIS